MRRATAQKITVLRFATIASGAPARDEWLTRTLRSGKHEDSLAFLASSILPRLLLGRGGHAAHRLELISAGRLPKPLETAHH